MPQAFYRARAAAALAALLLSTAATPTLAATSLVNENDRATPVDFGPGPGKPKPVRAAAAFSAVSPVKQTAPAGGADAATAGVFDAVATWPIIGIHAVMLPDGRVMDYGTDQKGRQGGQYVYDVWTPSLGTGASSHQVLPNTTATNIFCSAQSLNWGTGEVLVAGGSLKTAPGETNQSISSTTIYAPQTNTIRAAPSMAYKRWYPSIVAMPNGEMLTLGGRSDLSVPTTVAEIYNAASGWRTMTGISSATAFGNTARDWFYPRAWVMPGGRVFMINPDGKMYSISTDGTGSITQFPQTVLPGSYDLPTLMFAPGKLLSLRANAQAIVIDINGPAPVVTQTANLSQVRFWASATVLPDGRVLVNGGSTVANQLTNVAYQNEIWDPATGLWTLGATATKPRLYHGNALLLQDGSVLTFGGGAPGPVANLNAEIFYPPYLYASDGSGIPAPRPVIATAPAAATLGQQVNLTMGSADVIGRVTMLRMGSATHSANLDQRFFDLTFAQNGAGIAFTLPADPTVMIPGYYLVYAFENGVPSVAGIVLVTSP